MKTALKTLILALFAAITCFVCACSKDAKVASAASSPKSLESLVELSKNAANSSMKANHNGDAKDFAEKGIKYANECVENFPNEAACYYLRAVNTGLYHKVHIIGYQRGIKNMIVDCGKVIELDENYDFAGAYRILGQIYTQLPQTGGTADSVVRDLDYAEKNLRRAVKLSPAYPENHLLLAETLFEKEKFPEAVTELANAKHLSSEWRNDLSYNDWQASMATLGKKMRKIEK